MKLFHSLIKPAAALGLVLMAGCAAIQPARLQLPDELVAGSESLQLGSLGHGRKGQAQVDGRELRYERSAGRLELFSLYATGSATLRFQLAGVEADCGARSHELNVAGVTATKPARLNCRLSPQASLGLTDVGPPMRGMAPRPAGELELAGGRKLEVQASFQLQGAALPTGTPVGYLFVEQGRVVGAVDTNNGTVYLPRGDAALREACLRAGLALSLLWMPD